MKEFSYIKDKNGNLLRVAPMPVVFGRAIPAHNARAGMRYMVKGGWINIKGFEDGEADAYKEEDLLAFRYANYYDSFGTLQVYQDCGYEEDSYYIVTIPENFDIDKFIRNTDGYRNKCMKRAENYTGETMSPNFVYQNGQLVCIKRLAIVTISSTSTGGGGHRVVGNYVTSRLVRHKKNNLKFWHRTVHGKSTKGNTVTYIPFCRRGFRKYYGVNTITLRRELVVSATSDNNYKYVLV